MANFFKNRPEDRKDPQLDPSVQPKAQGLLHMGREYIAHHIRRRNLGLEHLIASMQPKKHSEDYSKHSMDSEDGRLFPETLKALNYANKSPGTLEVPDGSVQKHTMPA